ncbi:MAG TPA: hypothetical protein VGD83_03255 [Streptosporangiaceae bacterium]
MNADIAAYIGRWRPWSVSPQAAAFARDVITAVQPGGQERAKNLLWAAAKLADWALSLGLEAVPEVLLHPSVAERFTRCAPGLTGVARRTLRTNLRSSAAGWCRSYIRPMRRCPGNGPSGPTARRRSTGT